MLSPVTDDFAAVTELMALVGEEIVAELESLEAVARLIAINAHRHILQLRIDAEERPGVAPA